MSKTFLTKSEKLTMETKVEMSESQGLETTWMEISCKRGEPTGDQFARGVQDFEFQVGGRYAWRPSKSYFRIGLKLDRGAGGSAAQPVVIDNLAFADNVCANLYDNVYVKAGGANISSIINYAAQAHMIKTRLGKSRAWMNSVGKTGFGLNPYFEDRVHAISSDGLNTEENTHLQFINKSIGTNADPSSVTVTLATPPTTTTYTATVTGVNTTFTNADVGDDIVIGGAPFPITAITNDTSLTVRVPGAQGGIGITTNAYFRESAGSASQRANVVYVMWQPPVGVMDYDGLLGSGDYRIQLNPNTNFKKACVESLADLDEKVNYTFSVESCRFYACIEKANIGASGTEQLALTEQAIQTKTLTNSSGQNVLDFTVPPSTEYITIAVQSQDAGSNNQVPATSFITKDGSDQALENLQLTYANTTKPPVNWESSFSPGTNLQQQRYLQTMIDSGMVSDTGGCETMREWQERGALYHYGFVRDSMDRSTNLQLSIKYAGIETNANVIVCAHYSRLVDITTQNGRIVNVVSSSV